MNPAYKPAEIKPAKELDYGDVWKRLSSIDVSGQVRKKNDLNYLPWSWAWGVLMEEFPQAVYNYRAPVYYEDGSCEVWVEVRIENLAREMWLPVMNYKGLSIQNPSSKDISNTRMRCLVKCLAMFGLGHYIYAGEDLPELRGQTTGDKLDFDTITKAYKYFKAKLDEDADEPNYQAMQDAEANLNSMNVDYMIEVMNMFGKTKPEGGTRQYKNILADCLKMPLDPDGKPIRDVA